MQKGSCGLRDQVFAAFFATRRQHAATAIGFHSGTEPMNFASAVFIRLERAFRHKVSLLSALNRTKNGAFLSMLPQRAADGIDIRCKFCTIIKRSLIESGGGIRPDEPTATG